MSDDGLTIRLENGECAAAIRSVHEAAFGGQEESDLVDKLRGTAEALLSLVAEHEGRIVGHILFSRMWVETPGETVSAVALAPVAVLPQYQRRGIGGRMIRDGLERLRQQDEKLVIVVGHAGYYPRFGFSIKKARGLESPFPAESFMALELKSGILDGVQGKVRYPVAFGLAL